MTTCDHTIGVRIADDGELLLASEEEMTTEWVVREFNRWAENPHALKQIVDAGRKKNGRQHLESKYHMFSFCPDCGASLK